MVELRELMEIIPNFDFSDLNIIQEESSTVYQFYQDIENGLIQNDKEAIEHYFRGKPNSRIYYWRLKNKLYDKLANTYILTARKNSTPIQKAYFEIYRNYFIVNELYARNKNQAASILGEKTIDKAIKVELANIITSLCREVLKQYSTVAPNKIKVKKYISIFKKYSAIRNAEEEIELSLWNLLLVIAQSRNPQNSIGEFEEELNKTSTIFLKHPTLKIGFYYYMIQSYYYELKNDLWSTLYHCKKAIEFLETFENGVPAAYIFMFLHKKINIQIRLKQFKEAKINLEKAFCIIPKGTPNWYIINSYAVTLAFHEKDYHQAHGIIKKVLAYKKEMNEVMIEQWIILQAYVYFMMPDSSTFRLGKFVNEVPIFSKDKQGHNTNILILQILFLLRKGKHGDIIDRVESLKKYVSNYLRKGNTFRTSCFIKMLCQLPAGNFHSVNVQRRTKHYYDKMMGLPKEQARMDVDVEIVPYEVLWDKVLLFLK